jgi:hypothetical protein
LCVGGEQRKKVEKDGLRNMIVNGEDIKGLIIKDEQGHPIALITDEGAYYFKGYTVEVMDKSMEIYVDQAKGIIEVIDTKNQLNKETMLSSGDGIAIIDDEKEEDNEIIELSDYLS